MTALATFPLLNDLHHLCRAVSIAPLFSNEMQRATGLLRIPGEWPRQPGRISQGGDAFFRGEAAALGAMKPSSLAAHFYVFPRELVERALAERSDSDVAIIAARLEAGSQLMNRVLGSPDSSTTSTLDFLRALLDGLDSSARPGFAALADLEWPRSTWAQLCFAARQVHEFQQESRFHAAASQLSGAEYVALVAAADGMLAEGALAEAGWDEPAADAAIDQLTSRGFLIDDRATSDGLVLLNEIDFVADRAQRELSVRLDHRAHVHLNRIEQWGNLIVNDRQMRDVVQTT